MENRSAAGILNIYNVLTMALHGLQRANFQTESWAPMVVACVTRKLDEDSRQKFEEALTDSRRVPSITQLLEFLDRRYQVLLTDANCRAATKKKSFAVVTAAATGTTVRTLNGKPYRKCVLCQSEEHSSRKRYRNKCSSPRLSVSAPTALAPMRENAAADSPVSTSKACTTLSCTSTARRSEAHLQHAT